MTISSSILNISLDDLRSVSPNGSVDRSIAKLVRGINHRQTMSFFPVNRDNYGLTFFTRPMLNLSTQNARADRRFIPLLTQNPLSLQRTIRMLLDSQLAYRQPGLVTPLVDTQQCFIPLLTNNIKSLTGWPDPVLDFYTSPKGLMGQQWSMVDSSMEIFQTYSQTATFTNISGDPITAMFLYWMLYPTLTFRDVMTPYPEFIARRMYDYNTRIYRLILDSSKRFVQHIGHTIASFPTSVNIGARYDFNHDQVFNQFAQDVQVQFQSMGAIYDDPIAIVNFNETVAMYKPAMWDDQRKDVMIKVPMEIIEIFNYLGYPYIDPDSYELTWWVSREDYEGTMRMIKRVDKELNTQFASKY